jgi:hypothetical protein
VQNLKQLLSACIVWRISTRLSENRCLFIALLYQRLHEKIMAMLAVGLLVHQVVQEL